MGELNNTTSDSALNDTVSNTLLQTTTGTTSITTAYVSGDIDRFEDRIDALHAKAFELGEKQSAIRRAFYKRFEEEMGWEYWVEAILEENVVVTDGAGTRWAYPFSLKGVSIEFGEARAVERVYNFMDAMEGDAGEAKANSDGAGSGQAFADVPTQEGVGDGQGFSKEQAKAATLDVGNVLRVIEGKASADEIRVGNYMFMWGEPSEKDLEGEYFSKATDWTSDYTESIGRLPMDWEHARQPDKFGPEGAIKVPDFHDVIGWADMKTAEVDEIGLWVERVLNRKSRYIDGVMTLIAAGKLATSTFPIQGRTQKAEDGHIEKWPLYRDSFTVTPMEFRMNSELGGEVLVAAKSLYDNDPHFREMCEAKGISFPDEDKGEAEKLSRQRMGARLKLANARLALSNS